MRWLAKSSASLTRTWREAADSALALEAFEGEECHLGLDLASRTDLAALALVFPGRDPETGKATYTVFARCHLNEAAVMEARNASYPGWAADGHLTITPGNETDFDTIESDIRDLCQRFRVVSAAFDSWQSTHMAQRLTAEGVEMVEFRATTQNFSPAIIELDAAMRSGRLMHHGTPAGVAHRQRGRQGRSPRQPIPDQAAAGAEDRRRGGADDGRRWRHDG